MNKPWLIVVSALAAGLTGPALAAAAPSLSTSDGPFFDSDWYSAPPQAFQVSDAFGPVVSGSARLACMVDGGGMISDCQVREESAPGVGAAALAFFGRPAAADLAGGTRPSGEAVNVLIQYQTETDGSETLVLVAARFGAGATPAAHDPSWPSSFQSLPLPPPPPPGPPVVTNPAWIEKPTGQDLARVYPPNAARLGLEGAATIQCAITADGRLNRCTVIMQIPPGWGFGGAALALAPRFRMAPTDGAGAPTAGRTIRVPMRWMLGG